MKTLQDWAKDALQVQDARNLSGVVHSLSELVTWLRGTYPGRGTEWYNRHPLVVLYVSKLDSLCGESTYMAFHNAYEWTNKASNGQEIDFCLEG